MKTHLHANATTTPRTRAEIQASSEPVAVLARRYGVSLTTIYRWRKRQTVEDRSHVRHNLGQATTPEDEALIAELRQRAGLKACLVPFESKFAASRWRSNAIFDPDVSK